MLITITIKSNTTTSCVCVWAHASSICVRALFAFESVCLFVWMCCPRVHSTVLFGTYAYVKGVFPFTFLNGFDVNGNVQFTNARLINYKTEMQSYWFN